MFGTHITVAVTWQRASAGDRVAYAAEVSRRTHSDRTSGGENSHDEHLLRD
ncbi:hypothetical protein [Streptosporangium sandarakinum]|uniref:hypothetical protein n=1 Tax=Streptosporangium sandarakinum TaxID=1260955 RepID=UPI00371D778B